MKSFMSKLMTVIAALGLSFLLIEIGLRLFVPVTDHPYTSYDPDVGVHLRPEQQGRMTIGTFGDFQGTYRVNNVGWNSIHDYRAEKDAGTLRIAVVGDSFVEALGIDLEQGLHVVLEHSLDNGDACSGYERVEVYPFGYSGNPMSQYVSIMRYARERFNPDVYIVHIFPVNDFEPSLIAEGETGYSHVLTYQPDGQDGFTEVLPVPFYPSTLRRFASKFATVRFLLFNLDIRRLPWVSAFLTPANFYGGASEQDPDLLARFTSFVFGEFQEIAGDKPLLVTADADRKGIYIDHGYGADGLKDLDGIDPQYFDHIKSAAVERDVDYLPLHPVLESDYAAHGERFEFVKNGKTLDGHWNPRAHGLIGKALADWVATHVCTGTAS